MNAIVSDKLVKKLIQPAFNKNELIMLLQKVQGDFTMLDSKIKELLDSDDFDIESMGEFAITLKESFKGLKECAEIRNKKIAELLKIIKN